MVYACILWVIIRLSTKLDLPIVLHDMQFHRLLIVTLYPFIHSLA